MIFKSWTFLFLFCWESALCMANIMNNTKLLSLFSYISVEKNPELETKKYRNIFVENASYNTKYNRPWIIIILTLCS